MTVPKSIAEQRAVNYGSSKSGFQVAIQYCIEQALQGNADASTRIFRLAKMLNAKGELLADGRSVLDYLETVLDFKLLTYRKEKGDLGLVKDWAASVDGLDLAAMFVTQQQTPWATWKKPASAPVEQALLAAVASLEKKIQKAQKAGTAITASDRETMLGTLSLLSSAIERMPEAEEPEIEEPTPMAATAACDPELAKELIAEVRAEEGEEGEWIDNRMRISSNRLHAEYDGDMEAAEFWKGMLRVHETKRPEGLTVH